MDNQLTVTGESRFPTMIRGGKIEFSPGLLKAIEQQTDAPDASHLPYLPRAVVAEARKAAEAIEAKFLSPAEPAELREFLVTLHHSLNAIAIKPLDRETLELRVAAAQMTLEDAPRCAFGDKFAKACFARFKWMPTPADFLELANELAEEYRAKVTKVRLIVTHDAGKRFTLGYAPPLEHEPTEPPQLTRDQEETLRSARKGVNDEIKTKREAMVG
ncbi:hypothetical protein NQF87_00015 [Bombella sp. TMW 2.2559]|uniref:Uncharacterized protein n=1 Tax=Bombella dulcis TaxID=2967339 RepID=A0ABT3W8H1_9PROT|nr:hypothetical protein [Bombella dulcis]MCX5615369.1 hypothetical protein [Bombella dulcis]